MAELINQDIQENKTDAKTASQLLALQLGEKHLYDLNPDTFLDNAQNIQDLISSTGREKTREKLIASLRLVTIKAWNKVDVLLTKAVERHQINPQLIDSWEVISDCYKIYDKTLEIYHQQPPLRQLSMIMQLAREGNHSIKKP
jgi:hypothetical protein